MNDGTTIRGGTWEPFPEPGAPHAARVATRVSGIDLCWDPAAGLCTFQGFPVAMLWVDSTLAGLLAGVQAMVGTERFALALQAEGRNSVAADWEVIAGFAEFRDGFAAIANIAAVAGWGRWELLTLDREQRTCRFRVHDSWEGRYQKTLGVCWGSGMLAGKLAGYGGRLSGTNCWAEQTAFIARGDPWDEFTVSPSSRSVEEEIDRLLATDQATRADIAVALQKLQTEVQRRVQAEQEASRARAGLEQAVAERTAELRHQRNLLEAQFQASPDGILVTGEDAHLLSWNQRFREMWNLPGEALDNVKDDRALEYAVGQLVDPDAFLARVQHLREHPEQSSRDEIHLRDGRVFDCFSAPIRGDGNAHRGRLWLFRDVTENWRAEAERRQRVQFLEGLDRVERALWGGEDPEEVLAGVLDVCLEVFGSDRAWLLYPCDPGAPAWRVPMERTRAGYPGALAMGVEIPMVPEAQAVFRAALERDGPVAYDSHSSRPLPAEAAAQFSILAQLALCVRPRLGAPWLFGMHQCSHARIWSPADHALFREIGRRLADAVSSLLFLRDLKQSEGRYRELVEGTSDLIAQLDATGCFTYVNHLAEQVYGLLPAECLGREALGFVHSDDRERTRRAFVGWVRERTSSAAIENRQVSRSGEIHELLWTVNLHYDPHGRLLSAGAIGRDISERKRGERERLELERQLQHTQKLESLGVLAGGIAHDFNNLLMAILGNADLALLSLAPESPGREYVGNVERAAQQAAELTNQMLAYSGRGRFVVEPLQPNRLVREIGHLLGTVISKKATLRFDLAADLPAVEADGSQLRQVVMNLITNASEALGDVSGSIVVRSGVQALDVGYLQGCYGAEETRPGRFVVLEVEDTGCGMDAGTRDRIFDPFFTTKFTGRGLGLAAVLGIVRGHRGALRVDSTPGRGTTVRVLLPALDVAGLPVEPAAPQTAADPSRPATILLVDDDPQVLEVGAAMLRKGGHHVLTAADGQEAVQVYQQHREQIALVILDMTMPRMDGAEAFRELRRQCPGVRVIMSSGYDEQETASRFSGEGPNGFLQKPYRLAALHEAVRGALQQEG